MCRDQINSVQHSKYHGCWCPGSLHRQDISTHDINYVKFVSSYLTWGRISTMCVMSIWTNGIKFKFMFSLPLTNLAWKGLTHWGRVTHTCVGKLTSIGADNGLSPGQRQAIIWTNAGLLLIGPLRTNFSEILIEFLTFSFRKMRLKVSSAKRRPFCLGLNVLMPDSFFSSSVVCQ